MKKILTKLALLWAKLIDSIFGINKPKITIEKRTVKLNRAKRRFLASKLRKANHNSRTFRNIKTAQLPFEVEMDDFLCICGIAGVSPAEVYQHV
jgi:hypothetical protein